MLSSGRFSARLLKLPGCWNNFNFQPDTGCKFARVVKGVDLRSTAGNCAWVRTPQLVHCLSRLSFILAILQLRKEIIWVHSSVVRAADCRSAGPWFKSGCALLCFRTLDYVWLDP